MRVLFLTPWYPSAADAMAGLFVQKHAEAVRAQGGEVRVIHSSTAGGTWSQWCALQREGWMPDVVQLNVIQKQGLLALWLKRRYRIPYIVVEHWSGYLPENGQYTRMPALKRRLYQRIAAEASIVLTVSERLAQAMQACGIQATRWGSVNNVVDEFFYAESRKPEDNSRKTLLHVSCFDERAKNVKGLLRAAKMLGEQRQDWRLVLVGTGVDYEDVRRYADSLQLPEGLLEWTGELTPQEVADRLHGADALVLSSRYETYGIVLAEAVAAGVRVLSTPVGIAEETADLIVPQEVVQNKPGRFAEFIETILWSPDSALKDGKETRNSERFRAEAVGKELMNVYDRCLHHDI